MARKSKKRTRLVLRYKPIFWLLLTVVVLVGVFFSPVTSIRHVRIEGALPDDHDRLTEIVQSVRDVPCARVNAREVESRAMASSDVRTAEFSRTPFGSAVLKIAYRSPVARLMGSPNVLLSQEGILYPSSQVTEGLPIVQLEKGGPPTLVTFAATWQPTLVAKLAVESKKIFPTGEVRIQQEDGGRMCLNVGSERVILGDLRELDKKLDVLRQRIASFPTELSENAALDLTSPDNPALQKR